MPAYPELTRTTRAKRAWLETVAGNHERQNLDHYINVLRERELRGKKQIGTLRLPTHRLIGKHVRRAGREYRVQEALLQWHWGWYVSLLLERNESHVLIAWKNLSFGDRIVTDHIRASRQAVEVLA